jgi:hypothetical protein
MKKRDKKHRIDAALLAEKRANRTGHAQLRSRGGFHEARGYTRPHQQRWSHED